MKQKQVVSREVTLRTFNGKGFIEGEKITLVNGVVVCTERYFKGI